MGTLACGFPAPGGERWAPRIVFLVARAVHYGALPLILAPGSAFGATGRSTRTWCALA